MGNKGVIPALNFTASDSSLQKNLKICSGYLTTGHKIHLTVALVRREGLFHHSTLWGKTTVILPLTLSVSDIIV